MKYMTFNSSCSFAGVANLLEERGIDAEDREIALRMELPYLFAAEGGEYLAGPMLQSGRWFALYLGPLGLTLQETRVEKARVPQWLGQGGSAMLGIRVAPGAKHAVIFTGREGERFRFRNNKWQHSQEPEEWLLTEEELLQRLEDTFMVAKLESVPVGKPEFPSLLGQSITVLDRLKEDLEAFCRREVSREELMRSVNLLFRPILLDGITMLELIGQDDLAGQLRTVQKPFLTALRAGNPVVLERVLDLQILGEAIGDYQVLIAARQRELTQ